MIVRGLLGATGAIAAEVLEYWPTTPLLGHSWKAIVRWWPIHSIRLFLVVGLTTVYTAVSLIGYGSDEASALAAFQFGLSSALLIELLYRRPAAENQSAPVKAGLNAMVPVGAASGGAVGLILNGFWPVFGVASLGGCLVELVTFYRSRSKKKLPTRKFSYWVITLLWIVAGGIVTTFHGIHGVSALAVLQMGCAGPLVGRHMR
jgi:hypothetical protein